MSVYVAIMTIAESPFKIWTILNANSCIADYSEMYPDHWVYFRLYERIMGHVYMIVFWFHRICICTQHQNGVDQGNEKDVKKKWKGCFVEDTFEDGFHIFQVLPHSKCTIMVLWECLCIFNMFSEHCHLSGHAFAASHMSSYGLLQWAGVFKVRGC